MKTNFTYKAIGGGALEQRINDRPTGKFYHRTWYLKKQEDGTFKKARTLKLLPTSKNRNQARTIASMNQPGAAHGKFIYLAEIYIASGCKNKKGIPHNEKYLGEEIARVRKLIEYFGGHELDDLHGGLWPGYHLWRTNEITLKRQGCTGFRAVDKELQSVRNIFNFAMAQHPRPLYNRNPFANGCGKYQVERLVRHSTARAPKNADTIHAIAAELFSRVGTETAGWFGLFATFSGCRISELLRLSRRARHLGPENFEAGYVETIHGDDDGGKARRLLHLHHRDKHGINPWVVIFEEFSEMMAGHQNWHRARYPDSEWYFPNAEGTAPADRHVILRQIKAACSNLGLPAVTPHGYRSYFDSKHRSDKVPDSVIAAWMGDKTVRLIGSAAYGTTPQSWIGGSALTWVPRKGEVAWKNWLPGKMVDKWYIEKPDESKINNRIKVAGVAKWQTHRT